MDIFEAIHTRRSIRKFDPDKPVGEDDLGKILAAAMTAPSAGNAQPWHFIVVTDKEKRKPCRARQWRG
jgi:nitroreductase